MYEFAGKIVGKCLYESARGSTYRQSYRQLVKARFSRSFLAQLIGLRVHYRVSKLTCSQSLCVHNLCLQVYVHMSCSLKMFISHVYQRKSQASVIARLSSSSSLLSLSCKTLT